MIEKLTIIGERINPGFASSKILLENQDIKGIQALAVSQAQKGAAYLTINVGESAMENIAFIVEVVKAIQAVVDLPLSFDYPHVSVQEACLKAYDPAKSRGRKPIINSVTELRWNMLDVLKIQPAKVVLMASERVENGEEVSNQTAQQIADTARRMALRVVNDGHDLTMDDLMIDVSLCPIATDTEGQTRRAIESIQLIGNDADLSGIHTLVGLSNLAVMLPKDALDGQRLGVRVESAFLTMAMPLGLDVILGTPGRDYRMLPDDDFVMQGVREAINLDGFETLERVQQLYRRD
ncbi:MAG: dihydropteroate synthase [Phycisphaerales bacterium]|jgi:cobalamin-dependent methionine synthase I|nr:dihydropteroate synthase [Phycisphaerales bacterium]